jgi:hypothetical protein
MLGHSDAATSVPARWERFVFFMTRPPDTRDQSWHPLFQADAAWFQPPPLSQSGLLTYRLGQ